MEHSIDIIQRIVQSLPGFLLAICVHEASHAFIANWLGDDTGKRYGRLSLNPMVHYDLWGTVIFPLIAAFAGWGIFGWGRPVPVDTRNLKNIRRDTLLIALAGPMSNMILGILMSFLLAVVILTIPATSSYFAPLRSILGFTIMINFLLAFFNLLPFPSLDGGNILASLLPKNLLRYYERFAVYTPFIFLGFILLEYLGIPTIRLILGPPMFLSMQLTPIFLKILGS